LDIQKTYLDIQKTYLDIQIVCFTGNVNRKEKETKNLTAEYAECAKFLFPRSPFSSSSSAAHFPCRDQLPVASRL
jgi:hypothetical protein